MPRFLLSSPAPSAVPVGASLMKADRRTELGPAVIGDPSVPRANTLTTWGDPVRPPIPVVDPGVPLLQYRNGLNGLDPLQVWRTQPSVRKVVSFAARNIAAVPWHAYLRHDDDDRERVSASPAERALRSPQRFRSGYQFWRDVITDGLLYDAWCVVYMAMPGDAAERLYRISPRRLRLTVGAFGTIETVGVVDMARQGHVLDITDAPMALSTGWSDTGAGGVSPMVTLGAILSEQRNAVEWRNRKWTQSPKSAGLLRRPPATESGRWEPTQRDAFLNTWRGWRDGTADGTPILEDGMSYELLDSLNPIDAKDIEGRQLTDAEVASAFHIAPELVGARATTFGNVAAFREMLYGPALGPYMTDLADALNADGGLVQTMDDTAGLYVEQDREAAMNGSFMEQAQYLQTATGGPYMTRAEARGRLNLPFIEGSDELVVPLNVSEGGQASPTDSGSQNLDPAAEPTAPAPSDGKSARRRLAKAVGPTSAQRDQLRDVIAEQFRRMTLDVTEAGIGDTLAFHQAWDAAVASAVRPHLTAAADASARRVLRQLDAPEDAWSAAVMAGYLAAMADTHAGRIVATAIAHVDSEDGWPADPAKPDDGPSHVGLIAALSAAAGSVAVSALSDASGFGSHDAAHASGARTKTWETGADPRPSHVAINGETVAFADAFSIGVRWPGDAEGSVDETAGCNCGVSYTIGD